MTVTDFEQALDELCGDYTEPDINSNFFDENNSNFCVKQEEEISIVEEHHFQSHFLKNISDPSYLHHLNALMQELTDCQNMQQPPLLSMEIKSEPVDWFPESYEAYADVQRYSSFNEAPVPQMERITARQDKLYDSNRVSSNPHIKLYKSEEIKKKKKGHKKANRCYHFWDFLLDMLNGKIDDDRNSITWVDEQSRDAQKEFRIINTKHLAYLWGQCKNSKTMTYDKISRVIRYYIQLGILERVSGKRLQFKFTSANKIWSKVS